MMMGLVIHAPILFTMPDVARDFQIENIPALESWGWLVMGFISNWRMPLFFLLPVFCCFSYRKRQRLLHKGSHYKNRHNLPIIFGILRYIRRSG